MDKILLPNVHGFEKQFSLPRIPSELSKLASDNTIIRDATIGAMASNTAAFIMKSIEEFWASLPDEYDVGLQLTCLGQGIQVYLDRVAYFEPHLIIFDSEFQDGKKMRIVQHVTQLNYSLVSIPKQNPDAPKRKIGFNCENEEE